MADDRFAIALDEFQRALSRLHEVLAIEPETAIVRDALIRRFEFTFEAAWRAAFHWLRARGADVAPEAFAVLPRAFANGLIADEGTWATMRRRRNQTSHTDREALAVEVAAFVRGDGIVAFDKLAATLRARAAEAP